MIPPCSCTDENPCHGEDRGTTQPRQLTEISLDLPTRVFFYQPRKREMENTTEWNKKKTGNGHPTKKK